MRTSAGAATTEIAAHAAIAHKSHKGYTLKLQRKQNSTPAVEESDNWRGGISQPELAKQEDNPISAVPCNRDPTAVYFVLKSARDSAASGVSDPISASFCNCGRTIAYFGIGKAPVRVLGASIRVL